MINVCLVTFTYFKKLPWSDESRIASPAIQFVGAFGTSGLCFSLIGLTQTVICEVSALLFLQVWLWYMCTQTEHTFLIIAVVYLFTLIVLTHATTHSSYPAVVRTEPEMLPNAQTRPVAAAVALQECRSKEDEPDECVICLVPMSMHVVLPCQHKFHRVCIETWLRVDAKCPLCKQPPTHS